ncbi:MAG: bifunctional (p)ppGpp synthetase/guanosine-3',5'-bis(diphosphate) 3'-pyrophosphohydrolase [Desulfobacula sp.]|jgi:GTP diphosphokinase / guanosine-3',5'-bis(diphosphate) 3'-diphosphatase|nr:bifunctional (p)ppGpp synthetase/guanosine-3',5'-bis(diphosphate) 3'-pyrophosphohydrolase [Desulfobacula sp.]
MKNINGTALKINKNFRGSIVDIKSPLAPFCSKKVLLPNDRLIKKAFAFAMKCHSGQMRKSGEPYFSHPKAVAEILVYEMGNCDPEVVAATLLHDVVEDVEEVSIGDIQMMFGEKVSILVNGCTKVKSKSISKSLAVSLTLQKLLHTAERYPEIMKIKLADRLHNMDSIFVHKIDKQKRIAKETLNIYVPIAEKLNLKEHRNRLLFKALSVL